MAEPTAVGPSALVDMKQGLDDITAKLRSLVNEIKAGNRPTKNGISYLEVKHLLLFSYCETLVFYILRKSEGRSVKDHPLWKRLAEIKFILEKVRVWFLHKTTPPLFRALFFFFFFFFPNFKEEHKLWITSLGQGFRVETIHQLLQLFVWNLRSTDVRKAVMVKLAGWFDRFVL
jgi:hypothetical protein